MMRTCMAAAPAALLLTAFLGIFYDVGGVVVPAVTALVVVAGIVVLLGALVARRAGGGEPLAHIHAGEDALVERHEAGHMRAARKLGGSPVRLDKYTVRAHLPSSAPVEHWIAFLHAGRVAAGTRAGCQGDESNERMMARRYSDKPSKALRDGRALARRLV